MNSKNARTVVRTRAREKYDGVANRCVIKAFANLFPKLDYVQLAEMPGCKWAR